MSVFTKYDASLSMQFHKQATDLLGREHWIVTEPFVYYTDNLESNRYVAVPTGFLTDGASVPRMFWNLVPPWGRHGQSAVLHDYLCEFAKVSNGISYFPISREYCDFVFLESLDILGVKKSTKKILAIGINLYRMVARPPAPNVDLLKREIEEQIGLNYFRTGSFLLTDVQVKEIKQKFNIK